MTDEDKKDPPDKSLFATAVNDKPIQITVDQLLNDQTYKTWIPTAADGHIIGEPMAQRLAEVTDINQVRAAKELGVIIENAGIADPMDLVRGHKIEDHKSGETVVTFGQMNWDLPKSNYVDRVASHISDFLGNVVPSSAEMCRLYRMYALLALTLGVNTTWKAVHDAWSCWRADTQPNHKSLIPFDDLTPEVQALDAKYCDAIRSAATEIRDGKL